jgi:hypothetical protein
MFELTEAKYAVTVAVCEQETSTDIRYTHSSHDPVAGGRGYRVVENVNVQGLFSRGESAMISKRCIWLIKPAKSWQNDTASKRDKGADLIERGRLVRPSLIGQEIVD